MHFSLCSPFNHAATTYVHTLSLHDALPICSPRSGRASRRRAGMRRIRARARARHVSARATARAGRPLPGALYPRPHAPRPPPHRREPPHHRAPAQALPRPARGQREAGLGGAHLAREGPALRAARRPPPRRPTLLGVGSGGARRPGGAGGAGSEALLPAALRGPQGLGRRRARREARLGRGGGPGAGGVPPDRAAEAPRPARGGALRAAAEGEGAGPEVAMSAGSGATPTVFVIDDLVAKPGRGEALLCAYLARYAPGARERGMTLVHQLVSPAYWLPDGSNRLLFVWSVAGPAGVWRMKHSGRQGPGRA